MSGCSEGRGRAVRGHATHTFPVPSGSGVSENSVSGGLWLSHDLVTVSIPRWSRLLRFLQFPSSPS